MKFILRICLLSVGLILFFGTFFHRQVLIKEQIMMYMESLSIYKLPAFGEQPLDKVTEQKVFDAEVGATATGHRARTFSEKTKKRNTERYIFADINDHCLSRQCLNEIYFMSNFNYYTSA